MASSSTGNEFFPGFGFDPKLSDIVSLLREKESGNTADYGFNFIEDIQLYNYEPQQLFSNSTINCGNKKKYFFTQLNKKYKNKKVIDREIKGGGFWRKTGKSANIEGKAANESSFVYFRSPTERTQWLMKEYMLLQSKLPNELQWALCVVYYNGE